MKIQNIACRIISGAVMIAATAAMADDGKTLTHMAAQGWITDAEIALGAKFEAETGIKIDYQTIPADQYYNVLMARLNVSEGPDIFGGQSGYSDLLSYKVSENAVDLSDQSWASRLDPLVAGASSLEGKLYGMTYWDSIGGPWMMNYNMAMFSEHNVEVPSSYEELKTACSVLSKAGITPIYEPFSDGWHHVLMFAEMGPNYAAKTEGLVDALNTNKDTLAANATMAATLDNITDLYNSGCFGDDALSDQWSGAATAFAKDKAAMIYAPTAFYADITKEYPEYDITNIGLFIGPFGDNQIIGVNPAGPTKFVYSKGENTDEALQYLEFLARADNMAALIAHPAGAKNLPFSDAKGGLPPHIQAVLDANVDNIGTVLQTAVNYVNPQWMDIGQDISAMVTGMIDAKRVLSNIDKRRAEMASAAGDASWK